MKRKQWVRAALRLCAVCAACLVVVLSSCASPQDIPGAIRVQGVVRYVELEGGCWVLEAGDDVRNKQFYELTGEQLREVSVNDAVVTLWIVPKPQAASVCQIGQVAEIVDIVDMEQPRQ